MSRFCQNTFLTCLYFFTFFVFLGQRVGRSHLNPPPPLRGAGRSEFVSDSCQFLSDSKSLPRPPPYLPTPHKSTGVAPDGRSMPPTLSILSRLFAIRKLIKNQTPQKPSQNRKNPILERQMSEFEWILGAFWEPFSMKFSSFFEKRRNHDSIEKTMKNQ